MPPRGVHGVQCQRPYAPRDVRLSGGSPRGSNRGRMTAWAGICTFHIPHGPLGYRRYRRPRSLLMQARCAEADGIFSASFKGPHTILSRHCRHRTELIIARFQQQSNGFPFLMHAAPVGKHSANQYSPSLTSGWDHAPEMTLAAQPFITLQLCSIDKVSESGGREIVNGCSVQKTRGHEHCRGRYCETADSGLSC